MKPRQQRPAILIAAAVASLAICQAAHASDNCEAAATRNRAAIVEGFEKWSHGTGHPGDLLTPDARWTLEGSSVLAGTYHGTTEILNRLAHPLTSRLATPLVPRLHAIVAECETVAVRFTNTAKAADGRLFRTDYAWFLTMRDGRITDVIAFLNDAEVDDLFRRVGAGREAR